MWTMTTVTRRTPTSATCRTEHACTPFSVCSLCHTGHTHIGSSRPWVFHLHAHTIHDERLPSLISSTSPFTSTRTSSSFSFPSSPCTPTTMTPWLTTCATPLRGASSPTTTSHRSQSQIGNLKSFTLTILWNSAKFVKMSRGIIARLHHTDRRLMILRKEQCAKWRKEHLLSCCNEAWMKIGGQIPWSVTPIFETLQIFVLMGRRLMKDVLDNLLQDRLFYLVHWLSVTWFPRKTSQESTILQRKSHMDCSSDMHCTRGEFGRVACWLQIFEELETMDASEIYSKESMRKRWYFRKKKESLFSNRGDQDLRTSTLIRQRPIRGDCFSWFFLVRRVSSTTSRFVSGCWWSN